MKHLLSAALLALTLAAGAHTPAAAQSDILLRLRSGLPAGDRFRVDSAGGVIALGNLGIGIIPFFGDGERMMWHPFKAAFRAGSIDNASGAWDDGNVGFYSWAGGLNTIASQTASFAMGSLTRADGFTAIALGYRSTADADYAVAIGQRASANGHHGAIVLADGSTTDSIEASLNNQFSLRAAGGIRMFTNSTLTTGVYVNAGGSSWIVVSDRNRKENFAALDGEDLLMRLRSVPVTRWQYIGEEDRTVHHIGPMAQDWQRAFGLSADETTINMSDLDGVNLAAVQALEQRTTALRGEVDALRAENAALRRQVAERDGRLESLEERVARLEALLDAQSPRP